MVKLEENYRSTATILEAANALIANNSERIDKVLRPTRGEVNCLSNALRRRNRGSRSGGAQAADDGSRQP